MDNTRLQLIEMHNNEKWEVNKISENFEISFKIFEQTNTVSIKAHAELEIPWFNLVALIYEVDLFTEWLPFCKQSYTIAKFKKSQKTAYFEMGLPFIHNRDAYIEGIGIDRLDVNGTILIKCRSIQNDKELMQKIGIDLTKSKNVQIDIKFFSCEIQPITNGIVKIKIISNINPKVNFIPKWMINFFCKQFGKYLIKKMISLAKNIKNQAQDVKRIDKYNFQLSGILGQGSFGKVYKGKNTENNQAVAVKAIDKKLIQDDAYMMNGLFQEISIMKKFKNQNIVELIDVLETSNNYYIIQEFCDGGDLRTCLKRKQCLSEQEAVYVIKDLLNGFIELIKNGVIHRDLKPENILIKGDSYKLADFGFAKTVDNFQKQMLSSLVGTPLYMSPQILSEDKYTSKSDLWSLGFIFYECLYGNTPYTATSQYQLYKNIQKLPLVFPDNFVVSDLCKDFIRRCLVIDENKRIDWNDIFRHNLFQGHFQQYTNLIDQLEDKAQYIINELRQTIYKNQIDLEELFQKYDFTKNSMLDFKEFTQLMQSIDKGLDKTQIDYIFYKFDDNGDKSISFQEFTKWLSNNNVNLSSKQQKNSQNKLQQQIYFIYTFSSIYQKSSNLDNNLNQKLEKAHHVIQKLQYAILKHNINLNDLFNKYDKSEDQQLNIEEFSNLIRKIDKDLNDEETLIIFGIFDINKDNQITFQEFFSTLQKVHQLKNSNSLNNNDDNI
ncbi:protein kinase domain protein [Ichthyophthirius multifiliis]|uniref:Protein kinase domain protein n=1 Tax=Ichthyophthirius multifiliis TaxID=5932 RepID=G0R186_ICHMU|nr:protein kinase domain protein [Ichthyophthirius multifiliis]EGR28771.1 protein kinase domain protein [Ichthyophthirius multifiliis]|eukprot:XP_004030007.1 protein kinase domain protein [Ichthyophthirius multifiliis]